jgi:cell wall-associated NlpC family hydrolase
VRVACAVADGRQILRAEASAQTRADLRLALSAVEDFSHLQTPVDSPPLEQLPPLEQPTLAEQPPPPEEPRPPSHRGQRSRRPLTSKRGILAALAAAVLVVSLAAVVASRAGASTTPKRLIALEWAEQQTGKWYCWGGTGPSCFDCSGIVVAAYQHAGISLPRTTYEMLASPRLRRIPASERRRGDLAFYGTGHVELVTIHGTFGALHTGTRIGWHTPNRWWFPTMYFRVV